MHFNPVVLSNLFTQEETARLRELLDSKEYLKSWADTAHDRRVRKYAELEEVFSKKLEPLAREIFGDSTLKTTYSVYVDYNKPTSNLPMHHDMNACVYTIDYCVSAKTPWGVLFEDREVMFEPGQAVAFMGGHDAHGRSPMPDPENNRVEVIMFHFCPADHWYFTEGPDYVYKLFAESKDN
jgi:hypothetical protein